MTYEIGNTTDSNFPVKVLMDLSRLPASKQVMLC